MKTQPTSKRPSLLFSVIGKIQWRKILKFLFVLALISVIVSTIINDPDFILYSLIYFIIMLVFLMIDIFIEEYRDRAKFKSNLR